MHVVGRALVAIFNRQTEDEKNTNNTNRNNTIGFNGPDARSGSLTAKSYLKNNTLQDWQIDQWLKEDRTGYPRLCKYHRQLNEIAIQKKKKK